MCLDLNMHGDMEECEREYVKSFEYANSVMMKLLARHPPHNASRHEAILASFYCQACLPCTSIKPQFNIVASHHLASQRQDESL